MITEQQIIERLRKACEKAGSQRAWAERNGVSEAYVTDVLKGRRRPGNSIACRFGYEQVMMYRETTLTN